VFPDLAVLKQQKEEMKLTLFVSFGPFIFPPEIWLIEKEKTIRTCSGLSRR
jgi:hypothetical protein